MQRKYISCYGSGFKLQGRKCSRDTCPPICKMFEYCWISFFCIHNIAYSGTVTTQEERKVNGNCRSSSTHYHPFFPFIFLTLVEDQFSFFVPFTWKSWIFLNSLCAVQLVFCFFNMVFLFDYETVSKRTQFKTQLRTALKPFDACRPMCTKRLHKQIWNCVYTS